MEKAGYLEGNLMRDRLYSSLREKFASNRKASRSPVLKIKNRRLDVPQDAERRSSLSLRAKPPIDSLILVAARQGSRGLQPPPDLPGEVQRGVSLPRLQAQGGGSPTRRQDGRAAGPDAAGSGSGHGRSPPEPANHARSTLKKIVTEPAMSSKACKKVSTTQWYDKELLAALAVQLHTSGHDLSDLANGGGSSYNELGGGVCDVTSEVQPGGDEVDGGGHVDPLRVRAVREQFLAKIAKLGELIKAESKARDESLSEYLQLTQSASGTDRPLPNQRIRQIFEKKNQKCSAQIDALSRKQDAYRKRLRDVELYGVGPRQAKEVFKDVGHGIKTIVSKPKEFAHLIRNRFGSADNISASGGVEGALADGHSLHDALVSRHRRRGSDTLPIDFRYRSAEVVSTGLSNSPASRGVGATGGLPFHSPMAAGGRSNSQPGSGGAGRVMVEGRVEWGALKQQMEACKDGQRQLEDDISLLQSRLEASEAEWREAVEEERVRCERLEEQINDLTELHQNEVTNIKQELSSLEEKLEYQLEERTRDMQELLESCQTKITKMELQQQQQQQLITMETFDNSTVTMLVTKLINVFLALLAVVLVLINTVVNLVGPFLNTRLRCVATAIFVVFATIVWHYSPELTTWLHRFMQ